MKLLLLHFRKYKLNAVAFFMISAAFAASFYLYGLPLEAVLYPILFSLFLAAIFIAVDFLRSKAKYRRLCEISKLPAALITSLPEVESLEDDGYQAIVEALAGEVMESTTRASEDYKEMVDYYTVWAHQIKMPITAMSLTLQNEDSPLADKLTSELSRIRQYVVKVLAFLRLNSESSDYVFDEYELDVLIRHAIAKFSSEFIDRKLRPNYEPVNKTVLTDEKWLSFVIEQVLSNALKYTHEGSIHIFMSDEKTLCIADTGIGIAPEDLPRVFERGYTGMNGREDQAASGIGLYLCKRICSNLGADIGVSSEIGKGTTVSITFDLNDRNYNRLFTKM